jgi:hypothetical protein
MTVEPHNSEPEPVADDKPQTTETKVIGPHPWLPISISVAALLVAILSLGVNYFRSSDPPNAIIVTAEVKKRLDTFYVEGHNFYVGVLGLRRDISPEEFQKLYKQIDEWSGGMGQYIQEKLGAAERGRMLDVTGVPSFQGDGTYPTEINKERANLLFALAVTEKNLALLMDRLKVR